MFVKDRLIIIFSICIGIVSCSDAYDPATNRDNDMELEVTKLSELDAGYRIEASNWKLFLECWFNQYMLEINSLNSDDILLDFMSERSSLVYQYDKTLVEDRLGIEIPNSLDDFYEAYTSLNGRFIPVTDVETIGIYDPSELKFLVDFNPELAEVDKEWIVESSDEKYYQYGTKQDTSTGRNSYLKGALVVGKYGHSNNELILLFPNSKTKDGEMEASILSYASEFRTPSFAEMMRQISLLDTEDLLPPYPQEKINLTCARFLPLENVWWK